MEILIGLGAATIGWLFKWLMDQRKTSGRVDTSDAKTVWDQAETLRKELREQGRECRLEVERLELEVFRLRIENHGLRNEVMILQFATHPDIPNDLKDGLLKRQENHVNELKQTHADMQEKFDRMRSEER